MWPGVLDHLGAPDDGRHRRMALEVLEHLVDRRVVSAPPAAVEMVATSPRRDGVLVGVQEAAADLAVGAVADEQHRGALALGQQEAVLDHARGQLEHLLDADGHLAGLRAAALPEAASRTECVFVPSATNDHLSGDLVLAGAHADRLCRTRPSKAPPRRCRRCTRRRRPRPSRPATGRRGRAARSRSPCPPRRARGLVKSMVISRVGVQHGDALVGDLALERAPRTRSPGTPPSASGCRCARRSCSSRRRSCRAPPRARSCRPRPPRRPPPRPRTREPTTMMSKSALRHASLLSDSRSIPRAEAGDHGRVGASRPQSRRPTGPPSGPAAHL